MLGKSEKFSLKQRELTYTHPYQPHFWKHGFDDNNVESYLEPSRTSTMEVFPENS